MSTNLEPRNYDVSGMGPGDDVVEHYALDVDLNDHSHHGLGDGEVRIVRKIGLGFFRSRLVEHYDILWQQNKIVWPSSRKQSNV